MYSYCYVCFLVVILCILIVTFMYSYFHVYEYLLLCLCILSVMFMYSYCYVYVFVLLCYVFLLLYMFRSVYSVSLCRSVYCLCVNVYCTAATGWQPNCS